MTELSAPVRQRIQSALGAMPGGADAIAFVEAVTVQCAHPLGHPPAADPLRAEADVGERVIALVEASVNGEAPVARSASALGDDLVMLAAFFQNLDLLPPDGSPITDGIALAVVGALQRLGDTLPGG